MARLVIQHMTVNPTTYNRNSEKRDELGLEDPERTKFHTLGLGVGGTVSLLWLAIGQMLTCFELTFFRITFLSRQWPQGKGIFGLLDREGRDIANGLEWEKEAEQRINKQSINSG